MHEHVTNFILCDWGERDQVLQSILGRLSMDMQSQFTTGEYTDEDDTYPCIRLSTSGEYWEYCPCLRLRTYFSLGCHKWQYCVGTNLHLSWYNVHFCVCVCVCVDVYGVCQWVFCMVHDGSFMGFTAYTILTTTSSNLDSAQTQCNLPRWSLSLTAIL